jgi:hypothetical protein
MQNTGQILSENWKHELQSATLYKNGAWIRSDDAIGPLGRSLEKLPNLNRFRPAGGSFPIESDWMWMCAVMGFQLWVKKPFEKLVETIMMVSVIMEKSYLFTRK